MTRTAPGNGPLAVAAPPDRHPRFRLFRSPVATVAAAILIVAVLSALLAPVLAPYNPTAMDLANTLKPPGVAGHLLGTDALGRDILSRVLYGAQVSLAVGIASVVGAAVLGVAIGLVAGFYGGFWDDLLMRLGDVQLAFPFILLALTVIAVLGASLRNLVLILILQNWVTFARLVRGEVLAIKELGYITAAKAVGESDMRILVRHMLPQVGGAIATVGSFTMAQAMISEATLSFLVAGVPPPAPSWGGMLQENLIYINSAWWTLISPGAALTLVILSLNLFGDWVRDVLDPTLRR